MCGEAWVIDTPDRTELMMKAVQTVGRSLCTVDVSEIAAALLDQAIKGIEKDTLLNEDLIRIGQKADQRKGEERAAMDQDL